MWDLCWIDLLLDRPHCTDPYLNNSQRAAVCGKPIQDHFKKDRIPWEGPHAGARAESDPDGLAETKS